MHLIFTNRTSKFKFKWSSPSETIRFKYSKAYCILFRWLSWDKKITPHQKININCFEKCVVNWFKTEVCCGTNENTHLFLHADGSLNWSRGFETHWMMTIFYLIFVYINLSISRSGMYYFLKRSVLWNKWKYALILARRLSGM